MQISAVCLIQQVPDGGWAGSTASFTCLLQQVLFLTHAHFEALSPLQRHKGWYRRQTRLSGLRVR